MQTIHRLRASRQVAGLAILTAILIFACGSPAAPSPGPTAQPARLDGTTWRALTLRDVAPIAGAEPTIHFDADQAGGTTGCNSYGGAYHLDPDGTFRIGSMMMTEMACDRGRGTQEGVVIDLLSHADHLEFLAGGNIRISGSTGAIVFEEVPG